MQVSYDKLTVNNGKTVTQ